MDGVDGALLSGSDPVGGSYSLLGSDVQALMQFLWALEVTEILQLVLLVLIAGLIFGLILTNRWQV